MSIYSALWTLRFPRLGDAYTGCDWVTLMAQGVPEHIGESAPDPCALFLPSRVHSIADGLRAVVFVTEGTGKGTLRSPQEHSTSLLVLSGAEYSSIRFSALYERLCAALRGNRPRPVAEQLQPGGTSILIFNDGSTQNLAQRKLDT